MSGKRKAVNARTRNPTLRGVKGREVVWRGVHFHVVRYELSGTHLTLRHHRLRQYALAPRSEVRFVRRCYEARA